MEISGIEGTNLDARIKHSMLNDRVLQMDLTGDEFRAYMNLTVWAVAQVSDGVFEGKYVQLVQGMSPSVLARFVDLGLVESFGLGYRIHPSYWKWQSSRADLEKMAKRKEDARTRQASHRSKSPELKAVP